MLHITNGDGAAELIKHTEIGGEVIAWRDCLHEGATPSGLSLDEMSDVRAEFIAACGWSEYETVRAELTERDVAFGMFGEHDELNLWFEHDLYDQLQILQILHALYQFVDAPEQLETRLNLICVNNFEGIAKFHGLGQLNANQMRSLYEQQRQREPVTSEMLVTAARGWEAFCADNPKPLLAFLNSETHALLPFLEAALRRHLQQFPSVEQGLSLTEQHILQTLVEANGEATGAHLFKHTQARETARFLGDTVFFDLYLSPLATSAYPLIEAHGEAHKVETSDKVETSTAELPILQQRFSITETGRAVLAGDENHISLNGIATWRGGVYLNEAETIWMWDDAAQSFARY